MKSLSEFKLSDLTTESLQVMEHYGTDAPHILNEYCIVLEEEL